MRRAVFIYGRGSFISGQRAASEMLVSGLRERGWQIDVICTPLLDRAETSGRGQLARLLRLGWRLLVAWTRGLWAVRCARVLCVNLGQTKFALVRDGLPLLVCRGRALVSLHGSLFTAWEYNSIEARLLRRVIRSARRVAVLGAGQRQHLIRLGVPAEKVAWMDNTCTLTPIAEQVCRQKQMLATGQPIQVLFLSNLIEAKGYIEFVQAIGWIAQMTEMPLRAVLCGPTVLMDDDTAFATHGQARDWIEGQARQISQSDHVELRWLDGAYGAAKEELFRQSQVFVLPSRYAVEAQPLTILEALAAGCVVVTTRAGEIPSTVSEETAVFLEEVTPRSIAAAIIDLERDEQMRQRLALNGLRLFQQRFSYQQHMDRWEALLTAIAQ